MKLRNLIYIFSIFFYSFVNAQERIGILGGIGLSSYTGKDFPKNYIPNLGVAAGFFLEGIITKPFSVVVEANIEQKGVKYWYEPIPLTEIKINSKLNYISVPILIKSEFGKRLVYFVYGGTVLSYMFSHTYSGYASENGLTVSWEPYFDYSFVKFDTGLTIGVGMIFNEIFLDLRYVHGMKNIYKGENIPDIRNQIFTVKVGFSLYKRKKSQCYRRRY